jgi:hypothetical protein
MAEYPISPDLMQAFRTAIQAVRDWNRYGGVEPLVNYQGLPYPVSDLARHVADFGDEMSYELYAWICDVANSTVTGPADQTYEAGALCLRRLC